MTLDAPARPSDKTTEAPRSTAPQGISRESFGSDPSGPKIISQQEQRSATSISLHELPLDGLQKRGTTTAGSENAIADPSSEHRTPTLVSSDRAPTDSASGSAALVDKKVLPDLSISDHGQGQSKEEGGIGSVIGSVAKGAWDEIKNNPLGVLEKGVEGAGIGLAIAVAGPEVAALAAVGGIVYGGVQIYQHGGEWLKSADVKANPDSHTPEELAKANTTLQQFGAGAVDFAAGGLGGGLTSVGLRSAARSAASDMISPEESAAAGSAAGSEAPLALPKALNQPPVETPPTPPTPPVKPDASQTPGTAPPKADVSPKPGTQPKKPDAGQQPSAQQNADSANVQKTTPDSPNNALPADTDFYSKIDFNGRETISKEAPTGNYTQVTVKNGERVTRQHEEWDNGVKKDTTRSADGKVVRTTERNGDYTESRFDKNNVQVSPTLEVKGASEGFVNQVREGINDMPEAHQRELAKFGTRIVIGKTSTQSRPELASKSIKGDPHGRTDWDQIDAYYTRANKTVYVSEFMEHGQPNVEPQYGTLHEIGHAMDHARGEFSNSAGFKAAHAQDLRGSWLKGKEFVANKEDSDYVDYLRDSGTEANSTVGSTEAAAEAYAAKYGHEPTENGTRFEKFFPNARRYFNENFE